MLTVLSRLRRLLLGLLVAVVPRLLVRLWPRRWPLLMLGLLGMPPGDDGTEGLPVRSSLPTTGDEMRPSAGEAASNSSASMRSGGS